MPSLRSALFAGVAAMALAGTVALAHRAEAREAPATHVMRVALPDGSVAQIRYTGDVPPQVVLAPVPLPFTPAAMTDMAWPPGLRFGPAPFEALLQMQAAMDAQANAMLRAAALSDAPWPGGAWPGGPMLAAMANPGVLPPGVQGESVMTTVTDHGVCTRTIRFGTQGAHEGPVHMVTHVSGDCGALAAPGGAALPAARQAPAVPATDAAPTIRVRDTVTPDAGGHARSLYVPVADWQR